MIKFTNISAGFAEQSCELPDGEYTVGRGMTNAIVISDHSVSVEHAWLLLFGREVIVREIGSTNGTFVNGFRVRVQSGVSHGQILCFGRVKFRVEVREETGISSDSATEEFQRYFEQEQLEKKEVPPALPVVFRPLVRALLWENKTLNLHQVK